MSAFVCILERSGGAVDPDDLDRLASTLEIYGPKIATFRRGPVGIAVRCRDDLRTRHGPLEDPEKGWVVAVSGRFTPVDGELREGSTEPAARCHEPAAHAFERLFRPTRDVGEAGAVGDFLARVSGAFSLIVAHPGNGSMEVARDHLGSSKVYYWLDRDRLIAASEPAAILRHGTVSNDLDETSIARFLGFRFGLSERSYFREIRELPPAHCLRVTATDARVQRYWRFRSAPATPERPPEEVTAAFRRRLTRAIADDVAGLEPPEVALSLSGGLDSTAIAALAPRGVQAFSWTFNNMPAGDERRCVEQVSQHLDLPVHWVSGDEFHPLCDDFADRFVDENSPYLNPFSALKHRLYEAARAAGCGRVLVGDGGDALFAASEYWLRDTLMAGEPLAFRSLAGVVRRAVLGDRFARLALGRALLFTRYPRFLRRHPAPWLTTAARDLLPQERRSPILPSGGSARHELSVGVKHSELESEERRLFARCGVERGNPFWSWPLLELTIHLSAHWYHRDTRSKVLTREALRGHLPEAVLEGGRTGSLGGFFLRGLELRREELRDTVFRRPRSDWPRYVRREWVEPFLSATQSIAFGHTILWRVIAYELWYRRLLRGSGADETRLDRECRGGKPAEEEGVEDDIDGLVYGVSVRGRLPASFRPYLRPAAGDRVEAMESLDVSYRRIDELPKVDEIWASVDAATHDLADGGRFALTREGEGFGLSVSDQGRGIFHCDPRRIGIEWTAGGTGAAHYFFSYALPLWLEFRGVPALHGSAVLIDGRAVGFVGPSGIGKSVLAADLARLGCGLLADDGLVLRRDGADRWLAFHGPPLLRLWPSALHLLEVPTQGLPRVHETLEKRQVSLPRGPDGGSGDTSPDSARAGVPLAALYILQRHPEQATLAISSVARAEALVHLIEHSVAAAPAAALGLSAQRFELLADVVEKVPIRRLHLPSGSDWAGRIRKAIRRDLAKPRDPFGINKT